MAIPYRPLAKAATASLAAYLEVVWDRQSGRFLGGLLVADGCGRPVEFVHNYADAPSGLLWAESEVRRVAVQAIVHGLFDACGKSPALLFGRDALGSTRYCGEELSPSIPFAIVTSGESDGQVALAWTSQPPAPGTVASGLLDELKRRDLLSEPFARVERALREVYLETGTA